MFIPDELLMTTLAAATHDHGELTDLLGRLYQLKTARDHRGGEPYVVREQCRFSAVDQRATPFEFGQLVAYAPGIVIFEPTPAFEAYYGLLVAEADYYWLRTVSPEVPDLTLMPTFDSATLEQPSVTGTDAPTLYILQGVPWYRLRALLKRWLSLPFPPMIRA